MQSMILKSYWHEARCKSGKLVVVLHGRGDSALGFQWMPEILALPELSYLMVNAPDPYYTGFSWYDLPPHQLPGILRSRQLLDLLFAEIVDNGYLAEDILLLGFSQGCLMALEWGARTAYELAGVVGISGYCYDADRLARELTEEAKRRRWLVTHGLADEVLPYAQTEQQIRYLQQAGLPLEFHSFSKGHTIDEQQELPMLRHWMASALQVSAAR